MVTDPDFRKGLKDPCDVVAHEPRSLTQQLLDAVVAHMQLLGEELNETAAFACTHGWQSHRIAAGEKSRARIKELCLKLYGKDMGWVQ